MQVYLILKILKLTVPTNPKVTSYITKLAVRLALNNRNPSKEEIGSSIDLCLKDPSMRDNFFGIHKELEELGYKRVEIMNNALRYCKEDDKPNRVVFLPITFEPDIKVRVN